VAAFGKRDNFRLVGCGAARARSAFVMSTYYVCNAQETEADYIVKTFMAPLLNQRIKDHKIDAWIWNEYLMGDKYRRQLVVDGANVGVWHELQEHR